MGICGGPTLFADLERSDPGWSTRKSKTRLLVTHRVGENEYA